MAIVLEGEQKKFNWKILILVLGVIGVIGGGIYFLFFAPTPAIEVIVSPAVRSASELSNISFDPAAVVNSDTFRSLRRYASEPTIGRVGRANPFVEF
jgi:flagellar basal body-associated protein FliL